jgi:RHS repeat-associated protein
LIQASKTGQANQAYAYDDQGRRISKTVGTTVTNFLYGGPDIVAEYPSNWGTPTAQYTHGPNQDEPIERITQTGAQYFHHDGLGSVVGVTNNLGGTDATQRFDAWGNKTASTGTSPRYGYTGREPDETGLIYYRARYYDPSTGRFVSRDPIGLRGGINQYSYVGNNPVNLIDPLGLQPQSPLMLAQGGNYFQTTMTDVDNGLTSAVQSLAKVVPGGEGMRNATASYNAGNYGTAALWGVGALADAALAVGTGGESAAAKTAISGVAKSGSELTTLYRSVGPSELADIQQTGVLRNLGSAEGKYFTTSPDAASSYAKQAVKGFGDPPYTLIQTQAPKSILEGLSPATVDRGIPAWVVPNARLQGLTPEVINWMAIPK